MTETPHTTSSSVPASTALFSRRGLLRFGLVAGAGIAFAPTLAACAGPGGGSAAKAAGGTLTLGLNRSLVSIDNKLNQFDAAVTVQRAVRQALTRISGDLTVKNVLAESFEAVSDTQWKVTIREDAQYSDGTPVVAKDVATALDMYKQVEGGFLQPQFSEWPVVTEVSDKEFTLDTKKPIPTLDFLMSNVLITPADANEPAELHDGVGSGPYIVESSESGSGTYTLAVNDEYWGDSAKIEKVNVRFISEESSRVSAIRAGEVDVIDSITPESAETLKGVDGIEIDSVTGTRFNHLFFNFRKPKDHPLANPEVRRALTYAVDGSTIIDSIFGGNAEQANGVIPFTLNGFAEVGSFEYNPEKAQSELKRLGATDLALTLIWEEGEYPADTLVMEALVEMFSAVGVSLTLKSFQAGGDIGKWRRGEGGDWDILGNGYGNQTGLALTTMEGMYAGTAEKEETRDSYHGFVFPEVADLIHEATSMGDETKRNQLLADAQQNAWDLTPSLWAFVPKVLLARRSRVQNLKLSPINSYDLATVSLKD